ncbi:small integral membrane protein 26 [Amia ocellicauda]|uniref:small integral membrane protein 26 n=1 Tax=Amia ocellicauda TaxID=2972642 RepID=UPI003464968B
MTLRDVVKWNRRVSLLYAVGIWTMFGTYGYFQIRSKWSKKDDEEHINETPPVEQELADEYIPEPTANESKAQGLRVKSTVTYRDNFIPYSSRICSYLQSLRSSSEDVSAQDPAAQK